MTEQTLLVPSMHALAGIMRDYPPCGESGMADLKESVHAVRRKSVINAFCRLRRRILKYLELTPAGQPEGLAARHKSALRNRCSQMFRVDGGRFQALKTWMSWHQLTLFLAETVLYAVSWAVYRHVDATLVREVMLLLTTVGFVMASIDGGALWPRRVRYVNPDGFPSRASMPEEGRR
ncbi:hypothetical protein [Streptomyces alanosinicus]|uniref:Uncharacterized protein n=1 Tax=Streptomyces alanosinicus TaxID=68171 RepID=A0A918YLN7_9ACTN|nr:hypothetical protein [Streptomyces alanosinicus]GHE07318.1 hypothetical protein GCM10010339_51930 [Streptomyces alanosinicus]